MHTYITEEPPPQPPPPKKKGKKIRSRSSLPIHYIFVKRSVTDIETSIHDGMIVQSTSNFTPTITSNHHSNHSNLQPRQTTYPTTYSVSLNLSQHEAQSVHTRAFLSLSLLIVWFVVRGLMGLGSCWLIVVFKPTEFHPSSPSLPPVRPSFLWV